MNKIMYSIYHIPGVKIGCSVNPKYRVRKQGYKNFEILEEHLDIDIASKREIELQKKYGYEVDCCEYSISYSHLQNTNRSLAGKKGGKIAAKTNQIAKAREISKLKTSKKINVFDLNKNFLFQFNSITECGKILKINAGGICNLLKNKKEKSIKGYRFEYA